MLRRRGLEGMGKDEMVDEYHNLEWLCKCLLTLTIFFPMLASCRDTGCLYIELLFHLR
jgi:hypothetical protein